MLHPRNSWRSRHCQKHMEAPGERTMGHGPCGTRHSWPSRSASPRSTAAPAQTRPRRPHRGSYESTRATSMRTDTLRDANSVNTFSDTAKLGWAGSIPTAAENDWLKPSAPPTTDPTGSRHTTCELQDMTWSEKSSTNANERARSSYKHRERNARPPRPPVVRHRSLEARLSATRSQCTPRSEEKK